MRHDPLKWPFQYVVDWRSEPTGWVVLHSQVIAPDRHALLASLRVEGFRFAGMCSDGTFPRGDAPDPIDYGSLCEVWGHCFRRPEDYLPPSAPRALISDSDFSDWLWISRQARMAPPVERRTPYFVYVAAADGWKLEAKNWALARKCIPIVCGALGLEAVVVDGPVDGKVPGFARALPRLPWPALLRLMSAARFLLVPNEADASPRVIAEALCLNVPIVVNRHILGGWKYVNDFTGAFFESDRDVVEAVRSCLGVPKAPREWFRCNHGPYQAGRRLQKLLQVVDPGLRRGSALALASRIGSPSSAASR